MFLFDDEIEAQKMETDVARVEAMSKHPRTLISSFSVLHVTIVTTSRAF